MMTRSIIKKHTHTHIYIYISFPSAALLNRNSMLQPGTDLFMMVSCSLNYGKAFCITCPFWGESAGHLVDSLHKLPMMPRFDAAPTPLSTREQAVNLKVDLPVTWDAMALMSCHSNVLASIMHDDLPVLSADPNECASNPCQNGGTCEDGLNLFTCRCPVNVTGVLCDNGMEVVRSSLLDPNEERLPVPDPY